MKKIMLVAALGALLPVPALAQDYDDTTETESTARSGLRIEARALWERINDPDEANQINYELGSGPGFGGEIGYDIAVSDTVVVGPFGTYEFSTVEECDGNLCVSSGGFWAAGLHVGIATGTNSQAYIKGAYSQLTVDLVGPFTDPITNTTINFDESETGGGYQAAFGYEQGFGQNAYGRIELGIGTNTDIYGFDFQRSSIAVAIGTRF